MDMKYIQRRWIMGNADLGIVGFGLRGAATCSQAGIADAQTVYRFPSRPLATKTS